MSKEIVFYVIAKGMFANKLYIENPSLYKLMPTTTTNILNAKWYTDYEQAERVANKVGGEIEAYKIIPYGEQVNEDMQNEIDMLRAANKQLQFERDNAYRKINTITIKEE